MSIIDILKASKVSEVDIIVLAFAIVGFCIWIIYLYKK